jgi:uncharacterized protein YegP (UPF0339 family)
MKTLKAEMKQSADGGHFWHLKAGNNRIVLVSEIYTRRRDCIRSMEMAKRMATTFTGQDFWRSPMSDALQKGIYRAKEQS